LFGVFFSPWGLSLYQNMQSSNSMGGICSKMDDWAELEEAWFHSVVLVSTVLV